MFWLGIDGGGTKTAFSLFDDALTRIDTLTLPTCHYAQVGFEGMQSVLEQGVRWAESLITSADTPIGIGFAICGYGEGAQATQRMEQIARDVAGEHPHAIVNDVDAAWAAGLNCADGIALIAGTGSIAAGVRDGAAMRCGGWDYEMGDEGSGGWLGKELLRAFTRQADGRDPRGAIYDLVRDRLKLEDDFDLIAWAQEHYASRGDVSSLSPLVTQATEAGDPCALGILERAACEEADLVAAIARRLFPGVEDIPVAYIGGTFNAGSLILDPLARALPRGCRLVAPAHEPDLGPVLILRKHLSGGEG